MAPTSTRWSIAAWGEEDELADAYQARKSFAYGMDGKAKKNAGLLQAALKDVDLAYQNLESVELGVTTVDHYFDTLGGISRAVKRAKGGKEAPVFIGDQTRGEGKVRTLQEQVALETRSRSLNPKWFEGLLKHGHEGVRQIEAQVTNTLGWSATTGTGGAVGLSAAFRDLRAGRGDAPPHGGAEPAGLRPDGEPPARGVRAQLLAPRRRDTRRASGWRGRTGGHAEGLTPGVAAG
jgi:cobalamin biosynthesis Mg chelatase CobN